MQDAHTWTPLAEDYHSWQGTSMATPIVSGLIGMMLSIDKTLTVDEILNTLQSTGINGGANVTKVINAGAALRAVAAQVPEKEYRGIRAENALRTVKVNGISHNVYIDK
jgi:subtilisin family serine protease